MKSIRVLCMDCVGSSKAIRECDGDLLFGEQCPLHTFRLGKKPSKKKSESIDRCSYSDERHLKVISVRVRSVASVS